MKRWKSLVALTVIGALVAGPVWAQSSTQPPDKGTPGSTGTMQKDKAGSGGAATGGTGAAGASGEMKASGKSAKAGGNKEQVKAAQQALKDKGHDPGAIDGVVGPKTKQALRDFQKKEGLKESGQLDTETIAKLDLKTSSMGASGSTASSGASSSPSASPSTSGQDTSKSSSPGATGGQDKAKKQ